MFLSKLEISGFKSFYKRAQFLFKPGITGIVGPNGCGKSNIVDSIRWLMGENNARHLRGELPSDVIFHGSQEKKPLNYAEVTLTFDNLSGDGPPEYLNCSEIVLSRRLFRTGQKEYFINKIPCRLKDIVDFFSATGISSRSYAIIAQGQVEKIVQSEPKDIHQMIASAANLSLYQQKVKETEKQLEKTRENLSRVNDIWTELLQQEEKLKAQVDAVETYRRLQHKLRQSEIAKQVGQYIELDQQYMSTKQRVDEQMKKEIECTVVYKQKSEKLSNLQQAYGPLSASLMEKQKLLIQLNEQIKGFEEKKVMFNDQITERIERREDCQLDLVRINQQLGEQKEKGKGLEIKLEQLEKEMVAINLQVDNLASGASGFLESAGELKHELEQKQKAFLNFNKEEVTLQNQMQNLENLRENTAVDLIEARQRIDQLEGEISQAVENYGESCSQMALAENKSQLADCRATELALDKEKLVGACDQAKSVAAALTEQKIAITTKIKTLESIEVRESGQGKRQELVSQLGMLADAVELDETRLKQVYPQLNLEFLFKVLDSLFRGIIIDGSELKMMSPEDREGLSGLFCINEVDAGWATRMSVSMRAWKERFKTPEMVAQVCPLTEFFKVAPPYRDLVNVIFGRVLLVPKLSEVMDHLVLLDFPFLLITMDGSLINQMGLIEFDSSKKPHSILAYRKELKELSNGLNRIVGELTAQHHQCRDNESQLHQLETQIKQADQNKVEWAMKHAQLKLDVAREKNEQEKLKAGQQTLEDRIKKFTAAVESHQTALKSCQERKHLNEKERHQLEIEIETIKEEQGELERSREEAGGSLTNARISQATCQEKYLAGQKEMESLAALSADLGSLLDKKNAEAKTHAEQLTMLGNQILKITNSVSLQIEEKDNVDSFIRKNDDQFRRLTEDIRELEKECKRLNTKKEQLKEASNDDQLTLSEFALKMRMLEQQAKEKYNVLLSELREEFDGKQNPVTEEFLAQLRQQIEVLGPVNLMAPQDYQLISERRVFHEKQRDDITATVTKLNEAIEETTKTATNQFKSTFEIVNSRFKELFPVLFPSGEGFLEITDGENILEAGIVIKSRLPGKKEQNISLFSGGEKALTAICLIFSLLKTNPTSFCILDEVDAPLDEANVERYNRLLRTLSKDFQFIVVTHNKRTVEVAEGLYGITMQDPGITKVVSVMLH